MRRMTIRYVKCTRPNISAALAALATISVYCGLDVAALKDAGIDPRTVGPLLVCELVDDSSGTANVIATLVGGVGGQIKAGDSVGAEWGAKVTLGTYITAAGTYHLRWRWRLATDVRDATGAVVLPADAVAPVSDSCYLVAS